MVQLLFFGHLLTGFNFYDDEKTTGGRNEYGAKLANIFSNKFVVECMDCENGLNFFQTFMNNMHKIEKPLINKMKASEKKMGDSTKITFYPDLKRFKMTCLDDDIIALLSNRVYDIARTMGSRGKKLEVKLNGSEIVIKSLKD